MAEYRKKAVTIEAFCLNRDEWPDWFKAARDAHVVYTSVQDDMIRVVTPEGTMLAQPDDWIIRGVNGEIYPCKPKIFAMTYESADGPTLDTLLLADPERTAEVWIWDPAKHAIFPHDPQEFCFVCSIRNVDDWEEGRGTGATAAEAIADAIKRMGTPTP